MESRFYALAAVLLVLGLIGSVFVVRPVYTWSEACSTCGGDGEYPCWTCHGSGVCWICGGTGTISYMPDGWCAACQGSGRCYVCGGDGVATCETCHGSGLVWHWMYNVLGSSVLLSVFDAFLFVGFFVLSYIFDEFYLGYNEWAYEVEHMDFWFNPSFSIWLFATDRKRWAKWSSGAAALGAVYIGTMLFWLFSVENITGEVFAGGFLVSVSATGLFAWLFYKYYTSERPRKPTLDYEPM